MNKYQKRQKHKNRGNGSTFTMLRFDLMDSKNWMNAKPATKALVLELMRCHNGNNNGDLAATFQRLKQRGWRSQNTLNMAIKEAIHLNLIVKTRQGGLHNTPCLYALTWEPIKPCNGKVDLETPSEKALDTWKITPKEPFDRKTCSKLKTKKRLMQK